MSRTQLPDFLALSHHRHTALSSMSSARQGCAADRPFCALSITCSPFLMQMVARKLSWSSFTLAPLIKACDRSTQSLACAWSAWLRSMSLSQCQPSPLTCELHLARRPSPSNHLAPIGTLPRGVELFPHRGVEKCPDPRSSPSTS